MNQRASSLGPSIIDASSEGLILDQDGQQTLVSWELIEDIAVGTMPGLAGASIFVLAIEQADQRIIMCHEQQPIWQALIKGFADHLPEAIPFEAWGPALVNSPGHQVVIYTRQPMGTA